MLTESVQIFRSVHDQIVMVSKDGWKEIAALWNHICDKAIVILSTEELGQSD